MIYEFDIIALPTVAFPIDGDDEWIDKLFEAGFGDDVVSIQEGKFVISFAREAVSLSMAIAAARNAVAKTGVEIYSVTIIA